MKNMNYSHAILKNVACVTLLAFASCSVYDNYSEESYNDFWGIEAVQESSGSMVPESSNAINGEGGAGNEVQSSSSPAAESAGGPAVESSSSRDPSGAAGYSSGSVASDCPEKLLDTRDGNSYYLTKISNQCWFAENLRYKTQNAKCYENNSENCKLYGELYKFSDLKDACPEGTRVPTKSDWDQLENYISSDNAGYKLKSDKYWSKNAGIDVFGFAAYPAGNINEQGKFSNLYDWAGFWSSTQYDGDDELAWIVYLTSSDWSFNQSGFDKVKFVSVRCIVE